MRIAAGVLLILTACFNLFASIGYFGMGIVSLDKASISQAQKPSTRQEGGMEKKERRKTRFEKKISSLPITGYGLIVFCMFLLVTVVLLTIAAVFLFSRKQAVFIMLVACIGIIAEATGIYLFSLGFSNTIGIVACILAIIAGMQIQRMAKG